MTTLPQSHPDYQVTRDDGLLAWAVYEASKLAKRAYPDALPRMFSGVQLALAGKVAMRDNGSADVVSQTGTTTYTVNGACSCPDHQQRGDMCKHQWAAAIYKKARRLIAAAEAENITDGSVCPQCGRHTVIVDRLLCSGTYHSYLLCTWRVEIGEHVQACGWGHRQ